MVGIDEVPQAFAGELEVGDKSFLSYDPPEKVQFS